MIWLLRVAGRVPGCRPLPLPFPPLPEEPGPACSGDRPEIGPLKAERLRRAKTRLEAGEDRNGAGAASLNTDCMRSCGSGISPGMPSAVLRFVWLPRTRRTLLGRRLEAPGVVGSTLTDGCGDLDTRAVGVDADPTLLEDTDDALECVCVWWMLRIDEMDDEVDLRPRSPADDRR